MKKLTTICAVAALVIAVSGLVQAGTIASDPLYKASTDLAIGAPVTIQEDYPDYAMTGYAITSEFQINLLYQAGILDSEIDFINHYLYAPPNNWTHNFSDNDQYVLNISATGGLTIYEYDGLAETTGGSEIKWTLTGWHQTILAGDIIDNGDGTITLQVLPVGTYRPFVAEPPVNSAEVFDGDLDCEVLGYTFTGVISDIGNGSVLSVNLAPAPIEVWVDDDFDNSTPGWGTTHFATIQDGIDAVAGSTVHVAPGTYNEGLIDIDKSLSIIGNRSDKPVFLPTESTVHSNHRGWFQVTGASTVANFKNLKFDGTGQNIENCIRYQEDSTGKVENCDFSHIFWSAYVGFGIVYVDYTAMGGGSALDLDPDGYVKKCTFTDIERVGVSVFGVDQVYLQGNTYTGKGDGDYLDYAIEVGGGGVATIEKKNTITDCRGVASTDDSTSAGILVTTYFGLGTSATIKGNTISGNTTGIAVGYGDADASVVDVRSNKILDSGSSGIDIDTRSPGNIVMKNEVRDSGDDGIYFKADSSTVEKNKVKGNGGDGIVVAGDSNTIEKNKAERNDGDGIDVSGHSNIINKNKADRNVGWGIIVTTGTGNTGTKNKAKNNDLGDISGL